MSRVAPRAPVVRETGLTRPTEQSGARIIVVGRTGFESALGSVPHVEVIRARTTLQAIGELADLLEPSGLRRSIVLIAADSHPGGEVTRFITAVRLVDPAAIVLLVAEPDSVPESRAYDGVIDPRTEATAAATAILSRPLPLLAAGEALHRVETQTRALAAQAQATGDVLGQVSAQSAGRSVQARAAAPKAPGAERADRSPGESTPADSQSAFELSLGFPPLPEPKLTGAPGAASGASGDSSSSPAGHGASGGSVSLHADFSPLADDLALVQAALVGRDVLSPAVRLIRSRLADGSGNSDVVYIGADANGSPAAGGGSAVAGVTSSHRNRVEVRHREQLFGWLGSDLVSTAKLQHQAEWLGCWMALAHQQNELRKAALVDDLTGAWNRRYFERFLQAAVDRATRERQTLSVLLFDIDNFKYFNDKYGHAAGDDMLRHAASLMRASVRSSDRVCRIGGDEFAVIFYEPTGPREQGSSPPSDVWQVMERFQRQIAQSRFPKLGSEAPGRLTVSGGLATFPWDGRTPQELLAHADKLALENKRSGKDKITFGPDQPGI